MTKVTLGEGRVHVRADKDDSSLVFEVWPDAGSETRPNEVRVSFLGSEGLKITIEIRSSVHSTRARRLT